jgi:hypothetical protein
MQNARYGDCAHIGMRQRACHAAILLQGLHTA